MMKPPETCTDERMIVWVCERGHVDDYHMPNPSDERCSRCGGQAKQTTVAALVTPNREAAVERLKKAAGPFTLETASDDERWLAMKRELRAALAATTPEWDDGR